MYGQFPQFYGRQESLIRVTGYEGAKAYQMMPNSTVALFDGNDDIMYIKTTDGAGFATIKTFKFEAYVFADRIEPCEEYFENECVVEGYICQVPYYKRLRTREATAFMIAVEGKRTYYIPIVCWGRVARKVADFSEGKKVVIKGRCQVRHYLKEGNTRCAREISAYEVI